MNISVNTPTRGNQNGGLISPVGTASVKAASDIKNVNNLIGKGQTDAAKIGATTNTGISLTQTGTSGGYGGSGGSGSYASGSAYGGMGYLDYLAAAQAARQEALARANAALEAKGKAIEQKYNNQLEQVGQDYQKLRNQSEVNHYKALRNLRETQANRGLLNSGAGRQENLNVSTAYGNNLNEIGIAEKNERAQIEQAKNEMWANIWAQMAANEANINGDFTSSLIGALGNGMYAYSPQLSDYYQAAQEAASKAYSPAPVVANGQIAGLTPLQAWALYDPQNQQTWLKNINNFNNLKF